jgi:hypothetical protein
MRNVDKITKIRNHIEKKISWVQKRKFRNLKEKEDAWNDCKKWYDIICVLIQRCEDLDQEGERIKNQLIARKMNCTKRLIRS